MLKNLSIGVQNTLSQVKDDQNKKFIVDEGIIKLVEKIGSETTITRGTQH